MKRKTGEKKKRPPSHITGKGGQDDAATSKQAGVSIRTARRWRETGRKPFLGFDNKPVKRRIGKDGKSYPCFQRCRPHKADAHTPTFGPLSCARSFLRQSEKYGGQYGIDARDVAMLREIAQMAEEMSGRWATAIPQEREATHGR